MDYKFQNAPRVYGGLDLWMINDALEDDVLREQVREFYDKGCYSVIARTYNGLKSDYPGESFMGKMRFRQALCLRRAPTFPVNTP